MITALAKLTALPGKESFMQEVCITLAKETLAKEPGCLMYIPYVSTENPSEVVIIAQYVDQDALETHRQSSHFQAAKEKFPNFVEEKNTDILDGDLIVHILNELI